MKKLFASATLFILPFILPLITDAQVTAGGVSAVDLARKGYGLLVWVPRFLVFGMVAVLMFNIAKYVIWGDSADEKKKALQGVGWSFLGLFLALSIWGIIALMSSTSGIGQGGQLSNELIPQVPIPELQ